jgi:hypothetical protein
VVAASSAAKPETVNTEDSIVFLAVPAQVAPPYSGSVAEPALPAVPSAPFCVFLPGVDV